MLHRLRLSAALVAAIGTLPLPGVPNVVRRGVRLGHVRELKIVLTRRYPGRISAGLGSQFGRGIKGKRIGIRFCGSLFNRHLFGDANA